MRGVSLRHAVLGNEEIGEIIIAMATCLLVSKAEGSLPHSN